MRRLPHHIFNALPVHKCWWEVQTWLNTILCPQGCLHKACHASSIIFHVETFHFPLVHIWFLDIRGLSGANPTMRSWVWTSLQTISGTMWYRTTDLQSCRVFLQYLLPAQILTQECCLLSVKCLQNYFYKVWGTRNESGETESRTP
jgi:hypothetical protein